MRVKLGLNKRHDRDEGERAEPGANARAGQARRARARANVRRRELGGRKQKTVDALLHDRTRNTSVFIQCSAPPAPVFFHLLGF